MSRLSEVRAGQFDGTLYRKLSSPSNFLNLKVVPTDIDHAPWLKGVVGTLEWGFFEKLQYELGFEIPYGIGPRSIRKPELITDAICLYAGTGEFDVDEYRWKQAERMVAKLYKFKVAPLPLDLAVIQPWLQLEKSSGLPYCKPKREVLCEMMAEAVDIANGSVEPYPCVAYVRTQSGKDGAPKVRLIWGYPGAVTLLESTVARPFLQAMKASGDHSALGKRIVHIGAMLNAFEYYPCTMNSDWSKFDSTIPTRVVESAFRIVRSRLNHVPEYMSLLQRYFNSCSIIDHNGNKWCRRRKGIPSGSYFTSIIGTICNQLLMRYLLLDKQQHWRGCFLGDDSVIGLSGTVNTKAMIQEAKDSFGMDLDISSLNYNKQVRFLAHDWSNGRGFRPMGETLQRLRFPERMSFDVQPWDLVASLYGDNPHLWKYLSFKAKEMLVDWHGVNLAGMQEWERGVSRIPSHMLTI
jgi:hypothetical protein